MWSVWLAQTWSGERRADDLLPGSGVLEARRDRAAEESGGAGDNHRGGAGHDEGDGDGARLQIVIVQRIGVLVFVLFMFLPSAFSFLLRNTSLW